MGGYCKPPAKEKLGELLRIGEKLGSLGLVDRDVKYYSLVNGMTSQGCRSVVQLLPSTPEALGSVFTAAIRKEERKGGKRMVRKF